VAIFRAPDYRIWAENHGPGIRAGLIGSEGDAYFGAWTVPTVDSATTCAPYLYVSIRDVPASGVSCFYSVDDSDPYVNDILVDMMTKPVVVIGTGYVGLPAALMWAKAGLMVVGVDINRNIVRAINERTLLLNEIELQQLLHDPVVQKNLVVRTTPSPGAVFVIAVPTPVDHLKKVCDMSAVEAALESICPHLRKGNLVVLESTVPPMTCRRVVRPIIERLTGLKVPRDVLVAHCPERILPGDIFKEIVHSERLIGGMDKRSSRAAADLYKTFVKGALHLTDDVTAELSKLMENTYRDVNIALSNEFSQICELLGADSGEVIRLANRHPRVNILTPGIGVGGHCIPVDPWFLKEVAPYNSRLITMARLVNDEMPQRVAQKIRQAVAGITAPRIVALGATYKKNCEDTRESPAHEIVRLLKMDGYDVRHYDPLVPGMRYRSIGQALKGADLGAVLVPHDKIERDLKQKQSEIERGMRHPRLVRYAT
jgi:UDP-N-acetyl-D-mannosaminuronic acid dehydrogenase